MLAIVGVADVGEFCDLLGDRVGFCIGPAVAPTLWASLKSQVRADYPLAKFPAEYLKVVGLISS
jgi:hypothetical protein